MPTSSQLAHLSIAANAAARPAAAARPRTPVRIPRRRLRWSSLTWVLMLAAVFTVLASAPALAEVVGPIKNVSTNGKDTGSSLLGMVLGVVAGFMLLKALISRKFSDAATTLALAAIAAWMIFEPKGALDAIKGFASGMFG